MAELVRSNSSIAIPIVGDDSQLRAALDKLGKSPNKIKVSAEMSFSERQVVGEANRMIRAAEREVASASARQLATPILQRLGAGGGNGQGLFSAAASSATGVDLSSVRNFSALDSASKLFVGGQISRAAAGGLNFASALGAQLPPTMDALEGRRGKIRDALTGVPYAGELGGAFARIRDMAGGRDLYGGMTDEEERQTRAEEASTETRIRGRDQRIAIAERRKITERAQNIGLATARGDDLTAARLRGEYAAEDAERLADPKHRDVIANAGQLSALDVSETGIHSAARRAALLNEGLRASRGTGMLRASDLGDYGREALRLRQEDERKRFAEDAEQRIAALRPNERGDYRTRVIEKQQQEMDVRQEKERDDAKKGRIAAMSAVVAAERESELRASRSFYQADVEAYDAAARQKLAILAKTAPVGSEVYEDERRQLVAGRRTLVAQQSDVRNARGVTLAARRASAQFRELGMDQASGVANLIASNDIESSMADRAERPDVLKAQAAELKAVRAQMLRPRDYLRGTNWAEEAAGGPGGTSGQDQLEALKEINAALKDLPAAIAQAQQEAQTTNAGSSGGDF